MSTPQWIRFTDVRLSESGKTKIWTVVTSDETSRLGQIRWYGPWRKYAFYPAGATIFEPTCLRDLAYFCENRTKDHRAAKAAGS